MECTISVTVQATVGYNYNTKTLIIVPGLHSTALSIPVMYLVTE